MAGEDFTKNKMHFTIGLLAALFALHPFFPTFDKISFTYMGVAIPLSYAFMVIGVLLAGAVYCYATDLVNEQPSSMSQRIGNYFYATAIMTVPFYAGMYLSTVFENWLIQNGVLDKYNLNTPLITGSILVVWLAIWQGSGFFVRRYLTKRDWVNRIDRLVDREMDALARANEMMRARHFDLAILQFHKAVITRLTMACLKAGYTKGSPIHNATKAKILNNSNMDQFNMVLKHASTAASTTPVTPEAARQTEEATTKLLSTVAV